MGGRDWRRMIWRLVPTMMAYMWWMTCSMLLRHSRGRRLNLKSAQYRHRQERDNLPDRRQRQRLQHRKLVQSRRSHPSLHLNHSRHHRLRLLHLSVFWLMLLSWCRRNSCLRLNHILITHHLTPTSTHRLHQEPSHSCLFSPSSTTPCLQTNVGHWHHSHSSHSIIQNPGHSCNRDRSRWRCNANMKGLA